MKQAPDVCITIATIAEYQGSLCENLSAKFACTKLTTYLSLAEYRFSGDYKTQARLRAKATLLRKPELNREGRNPYS